MLSQEANIEMAQKFTNAQQTSVVIINDELKKLTKRTERLELNSINRINKTGRQHIFITKYKGLEVVGEFKVDVWCSGRVTIFEKETKYKPLWRRKFDMKNIEFYGFKQKKIKDAN